MGKEKCSALEPSSDEQTVISLLQQTDEAVEICRLFGSAPFGGIRDVRQSLALARVGSMLTPNSLLEIAQTIQGARRLRSFILDANPKISIVLLADVAGKITDLNVLETEILRCLDEDAGVRDQASAALASIRSSIRTSESRVRDRLDQMIRNTTTQKMLQDPLITIRNDRFVLPVKQEYRSNFGGIVHDQSSSGATLYMEPESVVPLNNKLRELVLDERREVERILVSLTQSVALEDEALQHNLQSTTWLDVWFAKANLANSMKATKPVINSHGEVRLRKARHPLIPHDRVVPIDVQLNRNISTLIITGPNTGGKTVTLKCVGLLTLMAMSGMFIPAEEDSRCAIFEGVYVDIGDEQSIEQSLSTFSSHMTQIVSMLPKLSERTLVLLDEVGAGTDPAEGSALARAILDEIHRRGGRTLATTHYKELKAYAFDRAGMQNASMEFDVQTLRPTYRLIVGVPGRSNAFAIAERLGLPSPILEDAATLVEVEDQKLEQLLANLESERISLENERKEVLALRRSIEQQQSSIDKEQVKIERERERSKKQIRLEAEEVVRKARAEAESIIADLKAKQAEFESGQTMALKPHEWNSIRRRLDHAVPAQESGWESQPSKTPSIGGHHVSIESLGVGDWVVYQRLGQKAQLLERSGTDQWWIQCGSMRLKAKNSEMIPALSAPDGSVGKASAKGQVELNIQAKDRISISMSRSRDGVKNELDLRGTRVEDAIEMIDRYLDEAILSGYGIVHLIHGKGTGALRQAIQPFLQRHPHVASFRMANYNEGGSGVTVVDLK